MSKKKCKKPLSGSDEDCDSDVDCHEEDHEKKLSLPTGTVIMYPAAPFISHNCYRQELVLWAFYTIVIFLPMVNSLRGAFFALGIFPELRG